MTMMMSRGLFNCKFSGGSETGLKEEIVQVSSLSDTSISGQATGKGSGWYVLKNRALTSEEASYTAEDFDKLIYTLYVRMMHHIVKFAGEGVSTSHVKPIQLPFHLDNQDYQHSYEGFDLIPRRQFEQRIKRDNHNCEAGPVIRYGVCSENFLGRYTDAARDARQFLLRDSSTIVPANSVLVWPGVPLSQHLGNSIPAWSRSSRPKSEVFVEWIFDKAIQCPLGDADNSVCTTVAVGETYCNISQTQDECYPLPGEYSAVNPWLGGDFNPWVSCDTSNRGSTFENSVGGSAEGVNEHIDNSCHPKVCDPADASITVPAYYSRYEPCSHAAFHFTDW